MQQPVIHDAILSQYRAALAMLQQAIKTCPETLWLSPEFHNQFWHVAYHALFYTHLYVQPSEAEFQHWTQHRPDIQYLGPRPWAPQEPSKTHLPYTRAELLEYYDLCRSQVDAIVPTLNLESESGFYWLPFNKLELQFYNIRHLQHHTGQLADRLRTAAHSSLPWTVKA